MLLVLLPHGDCYAASRHGHWLAVKVVAERYAREREERGYNVGVGGGDMAHAGFGHAGPANEEGYVHMFTSSSVSQLLLGGQAVLADVEAVVGGVDEVGVLQDIRPSREP